MKKKTATYQLFEKCLLLLVGTTIFLTSTHAQKNKLTKFLSANNSKYGFFIDLKDSEGIVFVLQKWMDKGLGGYTLSSSDTLQRQPANEAYLYVGKTIKIQQEGNRPQLFFSENNMKPEKLSVDTAYIRGDVLFKINNAYWWRSFFNLSDEINKRFTMHHYSFRNGLTLWETFKNKEADYNAFKKIADQKINSIHDSLVVRETSHSKITEDVLTNISTISYQTLKDHVEKLPIGYETDYFSIVIKSVCMNRPELFFKLADDLPKKKQQLFDAVDTNRTILKKLGDVQTDSPSKNEFFRKN
jgi:hypothetical protein